MSRNIIYGERVTKREWYDRYGGFTNPRCFRKADSRGHWRYFVRHGAS